MLKTSGGKYVAPQYIENVYRSVRGIANVMVLGDGKKFVSGIILPDWDVIAKDFNNGAPIPKNERKNWTERKEMHDFIRQGLDSVASKINPIERIKKFHIASDDWTVDNGILTPKLSLRRKVVMQHYAREIEEIYRNDHLIIDDHDHHP